MKFNNIILAAGRSSRMGFPKQLIRLDSRFQLITKVTRAQDCGACETVVVVGYHEARLRRVLDLEGRPAVRLVRNPNPAADQTSSMKQALRAVGTERPALMQLVDHPPPAEKTLKKIVPETAPAKNVRIPVHEANSGHPPFYPVWFLEKILAMPEDRGINSLYSGVRDRIQSVPVSAPEVLVDLDSPADLRRFRSDSG